ncbi:MAG TPA: discoidin domain-containing protein [Thermoanaerobaculia bacterium]|nr:discoidin domain-containing protein [Thermoanaerobaculia bacterium]
MRRAAFLVALLSVACGAPRVSRDVQAGETPAAPPAQYLGRDQSEQGNLLNIAYGASVVSRTAEMTLEFSAVRAIDGDPISSWTSPPSDGAQQTIVFSVPARTRVAQIGIQTPASPLFHLKSAQLDSSIDGVTFTPLMTLKPAETDAVQFFPVTPPRDVVYLRLSTLETSGRFARVNSLQVHGTWIEATKPPAIDGCWTINGLAARFSTTNGHVTGTIAGDHPVSLDGGSDGAVDRFVWVSGPNRGFAAITTAPDGKHLSGLRWYNEPAEYSAAESWFGERSKCAGEARSEEVPARFLALKHRLPLYGLHFDDQGALLEQDSAAALDLLANLARQPASQRFRLVSREYRLPGKEQNQQRSKARLDSLRSALEKRGIDARRFDWAALGSDAPPAKIEIEIQRNLYAVIELEAP